MIKLNKLYRYFACIIIIFLLLSSIVDLLSVRVSAETDALQSNLTDSYISISPNIYHHGTTGYLYGYADGNVNKISTSGYDDDSNKATYVYINSNYSVVSVTDNEHSDTSIILVEQGIENGLKKYLLTGTLSTTYSYADNYIALDIIYSDETNQYSETVYAYVYQNPVDAHVYGHYRSLGSIFSGKPRTIRKMTQMINSDGSNGYGIINGFESPTTSLPVNISTNAFSGQHLTEANAINTSSSLTHTGAYISLSNAPRTNTAYVISNDAAYNAVSDSIVEGVPTASYYFDKSVVSSGVVPIFICNAPDNTSTTNMDTFTITGTDSFSDLNNAAISAPSAVNSYVDTNTPFSATYNYNVDMSTSGTQSGKFVIEFTNGNSPVATIYEVFNVSIAVCDKGNVRDILYSLLYNQDGTYKYIRSDYTTESWDNFEESVKNAYAYLNDYKNTDDTENTQADIIAALNNSYQALFHKTDFTNLYNKYEEVLALVDNTIYDDISRNNLKNYLISNEDILTSLLAYDYTTIITGNTSYWYEITDSGTDSVTGDISTPAVNEYRSFLMHIQELIDALEYKSVTCSLLFANQSYITAVTYDGHTVSCINCDINCIPGKTIEITVSDAFNTYGSSILYFNEEENINEYIEQVENNVFRITVPFSDFSIFEKSKDDEYVISIPESVDLTAENNTHIQIVAENVFLCGDKYINISIDNPNYYLYCANDNSKTITFGIFDDEGHQYNGGSLCKFSTSMEQQYKTITLNLIDSPSVAGNYTGTITFNISVCED